MGARAYLLAFSLSSAALGGYYGAPFALAGADRRALLPGRTTRGHAPIEAACGQCHTPFGGVPNDACLRCHGEALEAAEDTHPESKFADPRNADRVAGLDARACVTCHREHAPDRTRAGGVTIPADFCAGCHEDVARERPSHAGFAFAGCASTGCHRFHDNRALHEDFMQRHLHEPEMLPAPAVPLRTHATVPASPTPHAEVDAPPSAVTAPLVRAWEASAHARSGVTCGGCHVARDGATSMLAWNDQPGRAPCAACHAEEERGFLHGKHGMRIAAGLSPATPAGAALPMKAFHDGGVGILALGCGSCHDAHALDTTKAAVEACIGCHDDRHTRAYHASRHAIAWRREREGKAAPGTGVSCATCHLPRVVRRAAGADLVRVDHDQDADLRPRDKMLRSVCLACHGLGFAIDALADDELVARNFNGRPAVHVESLEMVERRAAGRGGTP
jgi:hypothetical protein